MSWLPLTDREHEMKRLEFRNLIASKEWVTAYANHELAKYGEWQTDWSKPMREIESDIEDLLEKKP